MEKDRTSTTIFIVVVLVTAALLFFLFWKKSDSNSNSNSNTNGDIKIGDNYILGPEDASITIIEFSEFQCPYCKTNAEVVKKILVKYPDNIQYVFRDFPLDMHQNANAAAYAAEAAGKQGKYFEYHDMLFEMQDDWSSLNDPTNKFIEYAKILELDTDKFQKDMESKNIADNIQDDLTYGQTLNITGVPALYINGSQLVGAQTFEALEEIVLENLAL
ncbi:MAG: thioredoxin domain-containing protein [bacterium]